MTLRKIGGIYWFRLGRVRIAFCLTKPKPRPKLPHISSYHWQESAKTHEDFAVWNP
jgi:hypothetical protein